MLYAIVAVVALILDQLLKYWTTVNIVVDTGQKKLIPGFIHLANVHNTGAAFSFLQGARWFFVVLCIVFVAAVIYMLLRDIINTPGARWAAVIVLAGAVGNCIDRIITGYVVDMLEFEFKIFGRSFPVFNIADIYITIGAIVFCIFLLTEKPPYAGAAKAANAQPLPPEAEPAAAPKRAMPESPEAAQTDLFAEWERLAAQTPDRTAPPAAAGGTVTYTQPAAASAPQERPQTPAQKSTAERLGALGQQHDAGKTEQVMRRLVQGNPPAVGAEKTVPREPPGPTGDGISYDLDDILAEFKDS